MDTPARCTPTDDLAALYRERERQDDALEAARRQLAELSARHPRTVLAVPRAVLLAIDDATLVRLPLHPSAVRG